MAPFSLRSRPSTPSSVGGRMATGRAGAGPEDCAGPSGTPLSGSQPDGGTPGTPGGGGGNGRFCCGICDGGGGSGRTPNSRSKKPCAAAVPGEAVATASMAARSVGRFRIIKQGLGLRRLPNTDGRSDVMAVVPQPCCRRRAKTRRCSPCGAMTPFLYHARAQRRPELPRPCARTVGRKPGPLRNVSSSNSHGPSCFSRGSARSA